MPSREHILSTIKKNLPGPVPLPDLDGDWIQYADPIQQFLTLLESVGGEGRIVSSVEEIAQHLVEESTGDKVVVSCVPGVFEGRFDLSAINDPHDLADVDLAVLPGELMVAENGAIWVTDKNVPIRVIFFLSQHLSLVVPKSAIVHNMHEAYQRISPGDRAFGTFISGPSKTADIEQSLVKGAHGARTLKVFLVEDSDL